MSAKTSKLLPALHWDFVEDPKLREILTRDYKELRIIAGVGARKSTIVLCGSILEAVLLYTISTAEAQRRYLAKYNKPLNAAQPIWELEDLINLCANLGYLDEEAKRGINLIQNYRNLIHPNKEKRDDVNVTGDLVNAAAALFTHIIRRLSPEKVRRPKVTVQERFLKKLGQKCGQADVEAARQIIGWAEKRDFEQRWTTKLTYAPRLHHEGYKYVPVVIGADGRLIINFRHFLDRPCDFRYERHRKILRQRLNEEALDNRIPEKQLDRKPAVPLHLLANDQELKNFLNIFDWVIDSIQKARGD